MSKSIATEKLTVERLREVADYNPETGFFTWRCRSESTRGWNPGFAGKQVGGIARCGPRSYISIGIDNVRYRAHRLAWLYVHGKWPSGDIDHKDGNGLNNKLDNLRDVTRTLNLINGARYCTNSSGVSGVTWDAVRGKWHAKIYCSYQQYFIGRFTNLADAEAAVIAKRAELGFSPTHGLTREQRAELGPEAVAA